MRQDNRPTPGSTHRPPNGQPGRPSPASEADAREEHQAPGGAAVNRVAGVATSAVLGGATAGAVAGVFAGPVGAAVGAAVGAVAAGLAGNAVMASIDTRVEEEYWRDHYQQQDYVDPQADFGDYGPAYRYGMDEVVKQPGRSFEDAEAELAQAWAASRGRSSLAWDAARPATRDGWQRVAVLLVRPAPDDTGNGLR